MNDIPMEKIMLRQEDIFNLTRREQDIMNILWMAAHSLTASEIAKSKEKLSINTVQASLKKLMAKELIEVDQVVYSGTVLCRSYKPCISLAEFEAERLAYNFSQSKNKISMSCFVASFLDQEKDDKNALADIEALENLLKRKKMELKKKEE